MTSAAGPVVTEIAIGVTAGHDFVQQANTFIRRHPAMYLGPGQIAARRTAYAPAGNHSLIVKALELDRCVVLAGPPGSGREITAMAAIRELEPKLPLRRFSLEDEEAGEIGGIGEIAAAGPGGWLLHAGDGLAALPRCVDTVRAARGYLAVIADDWGEQLSGLPVVVLEPPDALEVYRHWVTARGHGGWADWDQAPGLLSGSPPASGRRLARLVEEIEQRGTLAPAAAQQDQVRQAYQDWNAELRAWFRAHRPPHDRALLVAAAALAPDREDRVYAAAADLAGRLHIDVHGAGLAWCPVTELGALLDEHQPNAWVVFRRLGYAEAILRHTIADYPLARQDLLSWLAALVTESLAGLRPRVGLAGTYADVAAAHGEAGHIVRTARAWAEGGRADPDLSANPAYLALSRTCLHPLVGARVRRALYEWSRRTGLPPTLQLVVAQVCELLGQTYPSVALTRLKHLAARGNDQVVRQVQRSVRALADGGQRAEVLRAVMAWCAPAGPEARPAAQRGQRRRVGAALFLEFAEPAGEAGLPALLSGAGARTPAQCLDGWRAALDLQVDEGGADRQFAVVAGRWLDAAVRHGPLRDAITGLFARAAGAPYLPPRAEHGSNRELTADVVMTAVARDWFAAGPPTQARRDVREAVTGPLTRGWWWPWLRRNRTRLRDWYATRSEHR